MLLAYLETVGKVDLDGWLGVDWSKLPADMQTVWLDIALAYALRTGQERPLERVLAQTTRNEVLAAPSRRALFLLSQLRNRKEQPLS